MNEQTILLIFLVAALAVTLGLYFLKAKKQMQYKGDERWKMIKNRIKEYRAKYDMKQEDLAKLVGVRRETIGNLEKGRYNPSLVLAWNIAKVFNVSIEDIFTVEN